MTQIMRHKIIKADEMVGMAKKTRHRYRWQG